MVFVLILFLKSEAGFFEVGGGGVDDADHEEIEIGEADTGAKSLVAALAINDDHLGARKLLGAVFEISEGDMDGLADMGDSEFRIGPDIEEYRIRIAFEESLDLSELEIGNFGLVEE